MLPLPYLSILENFKHLRDEEWCEEPQLQQSSAIHVSPAPHFSGGGGRREECKANGRHQASFHPSMLGCVPLSNPYSEPESIESFIRILWIRKLRVPKAELDSSQGHITSES